MYQCLICLGVLETKGFCLCGRLELDRKLKASGEYWIYLGERCQVDLKTHVNQCPHCGWKGLIVPKLGIGCPEHGIWWYKSTDKPLNQEKDDTHDNKRDDKRKSNRRDRDARREENRRHREKR